MINRRPLLKIE